MLDLVDVISEAMKDDDMKKGLAEQMCSNAMIIQAKIAGGKRVWPLLITNGKRCGYKTCGKGYVKRRDLCLNGED